METEYEGQFKLMLDSLFKIQEELLKEIEMYEVPTNKQIAMIEEEQSGKCFQCCRISIMGTLIASSNLVGALKGLSLSSSSSSFFNGDKSIIVKQRLAFSFQLKTPLIIESAHKKGAGSTKNGRDSIGKRLGVKIYGDQVAKPGSIIIRQRGTKFHPGNNVGLGKDYTIFSLIDGLVKFEKYGPDKKKVSVYPHMVQPENLNSRKVRQREYYRLRREQQKAKKMRISSPVLTLASAESKEPSVDNEIC
ncbi:hypothetical protein SUGI_0581590 [Cryptomeria japonica]|nr:hypothetical protein SUGI_0581590 [Cryptomeria japonica]